MRRVFCAGPDALPGFLDQIPALRYEMTPYERLDCADDGQFSGLEPEREAGVRWVHWRIWWRPEQEESGGQAVDPLALLGGEELRALLRATGWGDEASAGAGRGEIIALLRGCMRTQAESAGEYALLPSLAEQRGSLSISLVVRSITHLECPRATGTPSSDRTTLTLTI